MIIQMDDVLHLLDLQGTYNIVKSEVQDILSKINISQIRGIAGIKVS
jgi:hypothetical protein